MARKSESGHDVAYPKPNRQGPPPPEQVGHRTPILVPVPEGKLLNDLQKYCQMAKDLGAEEAVAFPANEIPQDIRVIYKCAVPSCFGYGSSLFCPPRWKTPWEEAKELTSNYKYAIVHKLPVEKEFFTGPEHAYIKYGRLYKKLLTNKVPDERAEDSEEDKIHHGGVQRLLSTINTTIESEAYYDGHYFAMAFAAGSCRTSLCAEFGDCNGLKGGSCRFPLRARPCGSPALYIDYISLAKKLGWKLVLGGYAVWAEDVPQSMQCYMIGIVLIA